jgi:hypothetical protein
MRRWLAGAVIALAVFGAVVTIAHVLLSHFYGRESFTAYNQIMTFQDHGNQVVVNGVVFEVVSSRHAENEDFYLLEAIPAENIKAMEVLTQTPSTTPVPAPFAPGRLSGEWAGQVSQILVPASAYENAQISGEPVSILSTKIEETKPLDTSPIAMTLGIAVSMAVLAVWAGYQRMWGGATSTLLEHGLHDMTVRDVEIVGYMMQLDEFTIPELMKMTRASKITVWRVVQKLVEKGLVQQTEKTRLAANGLGGRGKPSIVFRYVGPKRIKP